ncbi:MAG: InlB B-repeat-containing protein [Clostridia bacterium]|nr:InlB B-repeat-containing protein [Clostridia bacterium]
MKSRKLSTLKTPQGGGGHLNSPKIVEKADKNGIFSDLNTEEKPLKKEQKRGKIYAIILSIIFLLTALVGGSIFLILNHINKTNATTESPTISNNLFNSDGTINKSGAQQLLDAVGYTANPNDTGTYTAHNIAGRTSNNSGSTIIFPMGYINGTSGYPLYWQVTYLHNNYLTIWLSKSYTTSTWYSEVVEANYETYASSVVQSYIDNTFFSLVTQGKSALQKIFVTPATAGYQTLSSATTSDTKYYWGSYMGMLSVYSYFDNMSTIIGNSSYMWLPSFGEILNNKEVSVTNNTTTYTGQWGLNSTDRCFETSVYVNASTTVTSCWSRSGIFAGGSVYANYAAGINSSGSNFTSSVTSSEGVRPAAHISLNALKSTLSTTVTLDRQSGSGGSASVDASGGSAMPSITIPTRTGYTFGGYYTDTNGGGTQYYTSTGASATNYPESGGPTTLYAKWTANTYYVQYNGNGATSGSMSQSTHTYNTASNLTANIYTKTGYNFIGWATSSSGSVAYADKASVSTLTGTNGGVVTLYAVWEIKGFNIIVQPNISDAGSVLGGGSFDYGDVTTISAIPKVGYGLMYWLEMDSNGLEINRYYDNPLQVTITGDYTYVAMFSDSMLNGIACMAEAGGEVRMNGYTDSDTTIHFSAVAYSGYTFDGWYIYGETTPLSTDWSVDLEKSEINNKLIVAKFSETNAQVNTETNNTGNLT